MNLKKIIKYIWIVYAIFSVMLVIYLADHLICKDILNVSNRIFLEDHWNITMNDETYEDVELSSFTFDAVKKGDKITMETQIPKEWEYGEAALFIHNRHTTLSMYVDEVLEYEYGHERVKENKATGSGYLLINFYDEYKGKTLKLEYTVTENNAFSKFSEVWISEWGNSYRYIVTQNRLPMLVGAFLIVFGFVVTMILVFAVTISTKYINVLLLAIFSICMGIWTLCYYNVTMIFSIPLYSISLMECMSLFIAPIPIVAYMKTFVQELNSKKMMRIYSVLFCVQLGLSVVTIGLHTTDILHGVQMLPALQLMLIAHVLYFTYVLIRRSRDRKKTQKMTTAGLMIVVVCVMYELVNYFITRYTGSKILELKGISSVGLVVFIGVLVLDLYQRVTQSMMEENEKAILIKRAYTDELTQIRNRTFCSEYMRKISEEKDKKYTIINFDLNGLKIANDTYGHTKGDELICTAARVLEQAFSSNGIVGRMGGDEFIAIIESNDRAEIEQLIEKFNEGVEEENKKNPDLGLSISYGYAVNDELQGETPEKVYQLADKRMYECKKRKKLALQS